MAKKNYKIGDKLNFVGGIKIQITGVNADGTANFSELNPATKKPFPFSKGTHGKLPSLAQQADEKISLTSFAGDEVEDDDSVSAKDYEEYDDGVALNIDLTTNVKNEEAKKRDLNFVNLAGFKKFLQANIGKVQLKLVEAPPVTIHGNIGDTVIEHKALGKTRTVDKISSNGFFLDGTIVDWGKANQWKFNGNNVIWTDDDGYYLAYEIV
mgnify:CR=1 FL=1